MLGNQRPPVRRVLQVEGEAVGHPVARLAGLLRRLARVVLDAREQGAVWPVDPNGTVVGILPGFDRGEANPHVTVALPTGLGEMRNALIARAADAVIAVGGEYGTLSEIAFSLKFNKPIAALRPPYQDQNVMVVESPEQAVQRVLERLGVTTVVTGGTGAVPMTNTGG